MKKLIILIVLFATSCTRYITPERAANPRHKYIIRTTKGERKMSRLIRMYGPKKENIGCFH